MTAQPHITPATGAAAQTRFEQEMTRLGYALCRFPVYDALSDANLLLPDGAPERAFAARWFRAHLTRDYSPTAQLVRNAPDYLVLNPYLGDARGHLWLAEVKGESERWENLVPEAVQLLQNWTLAAVLDADVRYVYVPHNGALQWQSVNAIVAVGRVVEEHAQHRSTPYCRWLVERLRRPWPYRAKRWLYDPNVRILAHELDGWPCVPPAAATLDDTGTEVMPWP